MIISFILVTLMFDSAVICKEKLDASHSQGSKGYADLTRFRANAGQLCVSMSLCAMVNYSTKRVNTSNDLIQAMNMENEIHQSTAQLNLNANKININDYFNARRKLFAKIQ